MLSVGIKYYLRDLIYGVINCFASSFAMGKLSVYDQIIIKDLNGRRDDYQTNVHEFPSKR